MSVVLAPEGTRSAEFTNVGRTIARDIDEQVSHSSRRRSRAHLAKPVVFGAVQCGGTVGELARSLCGRNAREMSRCFLGSSLYQRMDQQPTQPDHETFERAVDEAFGFLVIRYEFSRKPLRVIAYERSIEFEKDVAKVIVQQEMGGPPWVTLEAPVSVAPGLRRGFGLHELEQEMQRLGRYQQKPFSPRTLQEALLDLSEILKTIGAEVVAGNFNILFQRQLRHLDAIEKSNR